MQVVLPDGGSGSVKVHLFSSAPNQLAIQVTAAGKNSTIDPARRDAFITIKELQNTKDSQCCQLCQSEI